MCSTLISKKKKICINAQIIKKKKKEENYSLIVLAICIRSVESNRLSDPVISVTSPESSPYSSEK